MSRKRLRHLPYTGRSEHDSMSDTPLGFYFRAALSLMSLSSFSRPALLPHPPTPVEEAELTVRFEGCGLILRDINTGLQVPVRFAIAKIKYSVTQELIPFRLFQYIDKKKNKEKSITDAAVAHMNFGAHSGKLMIIYKEDKGGQIFFVPESKKKKRLIG
jgi:hypothetical protein